jgi:hypothetical protein
MQYIRMRENSLRYYMDPMCKVLHRDGGPAVTYNNGCEEYWNLGVLHNSDGPAIETKNGKKVYYLFGKSLIIILIGKRVKKSLIYQNPPIRCKYHS